MANVKFKGQRKNFRKSYDTIYGDDGQRIRGVVNFKKGLASDVPANVADYLCQNENYSIVKSEKASK